MPLNLVVTLLCPLLYQFASFGQAQVSKNIVDSETHFLINIIAVANMFVCNNRWLKFSVVVLNAL